MCPISGPGRIWMRCGRRGEGCAFGWPLGGFAPPRRRFLEPVAKPAPPRGIFGEEIDNLNCIIGIAWGVDAGFLQDVACWRIFGALGRNSTPISNDPPLSRR